MAMSGEGFGPKARDSQGKNWKWNGGVYAKGLAKHMEKNLDRASLFLVTKLRQSMRGGGPQGTRAGATRAQRRKAARHRTGSPPNVDTARLRNSISFQRLGRFHRFVGAGVGSGGQRDLVGYAYFLEFKRGAGWRPWLRPGLNNNKRMLQKIISGRYKGPKSVVKR